MGPSSLDMLARENIISVKNQIHHPAHPCKDSKFKDSYKRQTVASEISSILISKRIDPPPLIGGGGNLILLFLLLVIPCYTFRHWVGGISVT
jgi:hypothetical protein